MMDVDWPRVLCGNDDGPMWEALNFPVRRRSRALVYGHSRDVQRRRSAQPKHCPLISKHYRGNKKYIVMGGVVS